MFIYKRKRKLPDGTTREDSTYSYRFEWQGQQIPRKTPFTRREDAERAGKSHLHALEVGRFDIANQLRMRGETVQLRLEEVIDVYRAAPAAPGRAKSATREANISALRNILRRVHGEMFDYGRAGITHVNGDLVWQWKQKIAEQAAAEDDERRQQLFRSANSTLRQARSVFSKDMVEYYKRGASLALPAGVADFHDAPGFSNAAKFEYHPPSDAIVAKTFESLAVLATGDAQRNLSADVNIFIAVWLAIGFGLRRGEISEAKRSWFITLGGVVWLRGDVLAKNRRLPDIRVQLGAWEKIGALIEALPADSHIIAGSDTERKETVFRRVSEWMRGLGWQTQHHIHEFRAWAGCQIAENSPRGLLDAQTFLRHASYTTTETYYGHHMKRRLDEVRMTLPVSVPFEPKIVNSGE